MREIVGKCENCMQVVHCENGFLNGIFENGKLTCFDCGEELKEE